MAVLVITRGVSAGRRVAISNWPATIGRDGTNMLMLDDERVSRNHARIKKRDRLFVIEDLDSKNGTFLNGDRVVNAIIQSGDKLIVGDSEVVFLTPEASIDIATEMIDFEHVIQPDLGIDQPIEIIGHDEPSRIYGIKRLGPLKDVGPNSITSKMAKFILEQHANILESTTLEDAAGMILKTTHQLLDNANRSAAFLWSNSTRRLIPISTRFVGKKRPFALSKRAFEDVISRKQGVIISPEASGITQSHRHRTVLPIVAHQDIICILHSECDAIANPFDRDAIEALQLFLARCAPTLESYVLRRDLDAYMVGMIETMIATIEAKDTYTHGHSERVSRYSMVIADEMQLSKEVKKSLLMSSLCHDIGKIGIPDAILRKASLLNPDEYEEMKQHPTIGANIINHLPNARKIISGVKYHHEKWDGTGYPDGLVGEEIPFFGRIVAVADVFDAMISGRSYSGFMDSSNAVEKLNDERELFDPDIINALIKAHDKGVLTQRTSTKQNKVVDEKAAAPASSGSKKSEKLNQKKSS
ncbi:MAG: HD domain-containing protein [Proteobacteria bacterium]|nr:HD domain-containing protein [Pseudomonadota bacterium]